MTTTNDFIYENGKLIASGTYGSVYESVQTSQRDGTQRRVAIKRMSLVYSNDEGDGNLGGDSDDGINHSFLRELNSLLRIGRHANIVTLIEYAVKERDAALVLERMQCTLYDLLPQRGSGGVCRLSVTQCISMVAQLCNGVEQCHAVGIMHRDIKPQNILIDLIAPDSSCQGEADERVVLKLADFGQSRPFRADGFDRSTPMATTLWYCAPEQLLGGQNYGAANDIWSTGCVVFHILTRSRNPPFWGTAPLDVAIDIFANLGYIDAATQAKYADRWKGLALFADNKAFGTYESDQVFSLGIKVLLSDTSRMRFVEPMRAMLTIDPELRPSASKVASHIGSLVARP